MKRVKKKEKAVGEPSKADLARMLRTGAEATVSAHSEFCISSDDCGCHREASEMLAAADVLDGGNQGP